MIIEKKTEQINSNHSIEKFYNDKKILFFDIETNGLSTKYHEIYMIGVGYNTDMSDQYTIIQWFNDDGNSELDILKEFLQLIKNFDILAHYNGDTFDLPFIAAKCSQHQLEFDTEKFQSLDIYKLIKHIKNFIKVVNMKQKSIETFLNIHRDDQFDGGQLIKVYKEFLQNHNSELKNSLLLHNHDDIHGLIMLQDIIPYLYITEGKFTPKSYKFINKNELMVECECNYSVPIPLSLHFDGTYVKIENKSLKFLFSIFQKELKHFYDNYKDYYYLTDEDYAIHKSIALFVDKNHRQKCTKENCYIKKQAYFLKQYSSTITPEFKENKKDTTSYFECDQTNLESIFESNKFYEYLFSIIKKIM